LRLGPRLDLSFENRLLGDGERDLALGKRLSEIFRASGAFAKIRDLLRAARRAVSIHDPKQNPHAHGVSPVGRNHAAETVRARVMVRRLAAYSRVKAETEARFSDADGPFLAPAYATILSVWPVLIAHVVKLPLSAPQMAMAFTRRSSMIRSNHVRGPSPVPARQHDQQPSSFDACVFGDFIWSENELAICDEEEATAMG
jgi:hypothetical protein